MWMIVSMIWANLMISASAQELPRWSEDPSRTGIYNYHYWYPIYVNDYLKEVVSGVEALRQTSKRSCAAPYQRVLNKKEFHLVYALGYFDDSHGIDMIHDGINWGLSPSLDIEIFHVVRESLLRPCENNSNRQACGFSQTGNPLDGRVELVKSILFLGEQINFKITLTYASASANYDQNLTDLRSRQRYLSWQSEQNYFENIGVADALFYNGHSRDGGGPDFKPPILNRARKVNYDGYYRVQREGIKRVLKQIREKSYKEGILGFFSCYSQRHFYSALTKANPKQKLVLSSDTIDYLDTLLVSMGYVEALMHGQCGRDLELSAQQGERLLKGFKAFRLE